MSKTKASDQELFIFVAQIQASGPSSVCSKKLECHQAEE